MAGDDDFDDPAAASPEPAKPKRRRLPPGQRRVQILQALAAMLEQPAAERVTTAALAARLDVSEAALYRHFASKAQMYEALIEFIESSLLSLFNQITASGTAPQEQLRRMLTVLMQFAEANPGMARVMVGDALVHEPERLTQRMVQLAERIEAQFRQVLREPQPEPAGLGMPAATPTPTPTPRPPVDAQVQAAALTAWALGVVHRYVRSAFKVRPTDHLDRTLAWLLG
jgi:TetR/AcrR family transcriptional regulator